jgi:hypothetical protein
LEEVEPIAADPTLGDVVVNLHEPGETVFQAIARAGATPGVDPFDPALFITVPRGEMPLANDRTEPLLPLDARGVAAILEFELDSADYEASRMLVDEPPLPREPRIPVQDLWPALEAAHYRVGTRRRSFSSYPEPRSTLAHLTDLDVRLIHRICSGHQKTVAVSAAVTIFDALGRGDLAHKVEVEQVQPWLTKRSLAYYYRLEYVDALARFAHTALNDPDLTDDERQALDDICWRSAAAQLGDGPDGEILTAEERLVAADGLFLAAHDREPIPLSRRMRDRARSMFRTERAVARARARELRKGTHRGGAMTASAVYARTHRLREANALPRKSRPLSYTPPPDYNSVGSRNSVPRSTLQ